MFGLGMGEILLIAVVALLAVGPDRLPQAARSIGRGLRDLRKQTTDLQQALETDNEIGDAVRELRSAWHGTTRGLPKNRYELGRALDQMSRDELPPAPAPGSQAAESSESQTAEPAPPAPVAEGGDELPEDDGMPRIKPPSGTIARGGREEAPSDSPSPADAPETESGEAAKPAHG